MRGRTGSSLSAAFVAALASFLWVGLAAAQEGGAAAVRVVDAATLRALTMDLLGRPPFEHEREVHRGRPFEEVARELVGCEEFWDCWLEEQLYYYLLIDNFRPRTERVESIPAELHGGRLGVREATHRIVLSASFDQRNPGPDTFVSVVLEQLLGRTVQKDPRELQAGKRLYDGQEGPFLGRRGSSQAHVVRFAIEDKAFLPAFLRREHERCLRREPGARDLALWARRLEEDPLSYADLVRAWILGPAYEARLREEIPQPNRLYVRAIYVDLLDRLPDAEEERRMRGVLDALADPGPLRSVLARMLLDSGRTTIPEKDAIADPTAWISGLFERLLGRAASAAELSAFVSAFHDPECRPTTVAYAIVSHPEYQRF